MKQSALALPIGAALIAICTANLGFAADGAAGDAPTEAGAIEPAQDASSTSAGKAGASERSAKLEEIVVTGFRRSLAESVASKREAAVISDTISSEDIGKFPEENMAESLQRITGVQITRSNGEGQFVSVRGLDPKFTDVLYNGRELPSPTGSRSFDFTILSADFVRALEVYKTPTADMPEGGLAATVNVATLRPLDYGKERFAVTAEGMYDQNAKGSVEPHLAAIFTNVFLDKKLGWLAGVDYSKRRLNIEQYQAFGMQPTVGNTGAPGNISGVANYNLQNATNLGEEIGTRSRTSFISMLQFRPSDNFEGRADVLYSKFKNDTILPLDSLREVNVTGSVNSSVIDSNGNVVYYNANGIDNRNNARSNQRDETLKSFGLGGTLSLGSWELNGEASYSRALQLYTDISLEVLGRASGFYDLRTDPSGVPTIGYNSNYNPLDPNNFNAIGVNGNVDQPTSDLIRNVKLDVAHVIEAGWLRNAHFGLDFTDREFSTGSSVLSVPAQKIAGALGIPYDPTVEGGSFNAAPWMQLYGGSSFLSGYGGSSTFPATWLAADPHAFLRGMPLSQLEALSPLTQNEPSVTATREKAYSAFAKLDFASPDKRWSGNAGVRFVRTDETAQGFAPDFSAGIVFSQQGATTTPNVVKFTSVSNRYSKVLPSLNLSYKISDDLVARLAAAKVMQRPDLNVLAPTTLINANVRSITEGNPNVAPYLANQFDLSLEWYFNDQSLLSLALFYKDVKNFIVSTTFSETLPIIQAEGGGVVPTQFTVQQPNNGGGSKIKGVEIGYQQPFTFLPGGLSGLGALANYTHIDASDVRVVQGGMLLPTPGVSKNSYNVGLYYENQMVGAHFVYNYRSQYVSDPLSYFGDGAFVKAYGQLDCSANYNFNRYVALTFAVINVTNEPLITVDSYGINRGYELDGRRFTLGVRASL